ncbi:MAG: hypothetical protein MUC96_23400 [Myxococcaceae bacterium]|nr:hypothetical protein [Myxococcaceae bacterium]
MAWNLSVIVFRGDFGWVAQCLEIDLGAQGESVEASLRDLQQTMVGQAMVDATAGLAPFSDFKPAPAWYHEQYEAAAGHAVFDVNLGPVTGRPLVARLTVRVSS